LSKERDENRRKFERKQKAELQEVQDKQARFVNCSCNSSHCVHY